jgi:FKBP-type peptidyl-prolyl cis-trans isomerase
LTVPNRGRPIAFSLAGVIDGWTEGVGSMNEAERRLIIPATSAMAGGSRRHRPQRHAIFDVELLQVGGEPTVVRGRP